MIRKPMIFAATSDLSGKTRGKAFPADQLQKRLTRGMGWVPTNVQITCFDTIADSPFGSFGDLALVPDATAQVHVDFEDGTPPEHFMLGDIRTLDGQPWGFCTRSILRQALERLEKLSGARLLAAFEHEFQFAKGATLIHQGFGLQGHSEHAQFGETLIAALELAGLQPDSFICEYGPDQFEVTIAPEEGIKAADSAVITRELVRMSARRTGQQATFTPIRDVASVGNGVHVHMSFVGESGPMTYDPDGPNGMSELTGAFSAGVLKYLESILALTAPSVISYERLTPHRWSAAYNNLGLQDREASLRICPVTAKDPHGIARQFNIEYRAADAAASPHLALAAIVHAGCQGIEENLAAPQVTEEDLSLLSGEDLAAKGFVRLPETLEEALARFASNPTVTGWFDPQFADVYVAHKKAEAAFLENMDTAQRCAAYEEVY
ncbi:glutamine synthetase family protein [Roseibium sp. SCP14]|uniref:glutamine synthetase family protein n=1 Tax=Roseibium sp. SCP14 TaxID=3141375 RepID=UPI0033350AB9